MRFLTAMLFLVTMRTRVDARLRQEAAHFRLQFACVHCAYFDDLTRTCSEGYPTEEHEADDLAGDEVIFCKLFEGAR